MRRIWECIYGVVGNQINPKKAVSPGVVQPKGLPTFSDDGAILPPLRSGEGQ